MYWYIRVCVSCGWQENISQALVFLDIFLIFIFLCGDIFSIFSSTEGGVAAVFEQWDSGIIGLLAVLPQLPVMVRQFIAPETFDSPKISTALPLCAPAADCQRGHRGDEPETRGGFPCPGHPEAWPDWECFPGGQWQGWGDQNPPQRHRADPQAARGGKGRALLQALPATNWAPQTALLGCLALLAPWHSVGVCHWLHFFGCQGPV